MESSTQVLRRMLDERGVEWHDTKIGRGFITVYEYDGITWIATEHSSGCLSIKGCVKPTQGHYDGMTPEQVIAVTLMPQIVRCKDCKYMFDWAYDRMLCKMWADADIDEPEGNVLYPCVKPDGFCAWGERRDA